jgi:hypothetical protein
MLRHPVARLIPAQLRTEDCPLVEALERMAETQGVSKVAANAVFQALPLELRSAPAFKDRFTGIWRYEYGIPYAVGRAGQIVTGTDQAPKVGVLLKGVLVLLRKLPRQQCAVVLRRLADRRKHREMLAELDPVVRPLDPFSVEYEVSGYGRRGRKIDWHIQFPDGTACLLEVKHRIKGLLSHLEGIALAAKQGVSPQLGAPLPNGLFRDVDTKFAHARAGRYQGVWIVTGIWYDEVALGEEFEALDQSKVGFAVLTHFEGDARILTRDQATRDWLKDRFRLEDLKPPWERDGNLSAGRDSLTG